MNASPAVARLIALVLLVPALALAAEAPVQPLAADTPQTTALGNPFVAPEEWTVERQGAATILRPPEEGSVIALVDVPEAKAADADAAVQAAWQAYQPDATWPLKVTHERPDREGWSRQRSYQYRTSPSERRSVSAFARFANGVWTVVIYDLADAVGEKRGSQVGVIFDRLLPKGHERESFAGRKAHALDAGRLAELRRFVEDGRRKLKLPGAAVGIVQGGKVVFAEGFGERELGGGVPVDADTRFMIASNTKALTTLLLAKLVESGKVTWETPVTDILPAFGLGDPATTKQVRVEHLICACTGMPRQDLEWIFEFGDLTPARSLEILAGMRPTSEFGALFQYSNLMAGAAGFAAGHVLHPELELGAAYDRAMRERVFEPLGMTSTTFDFAAALAGNHAAAHSQTLAGEPALAVMAVNYAVVPVRPAGGAWSNVGDVLRYVQMELDEGELRDGRRYIAREPLLARRAPQVALGKDGTYGMGLMVDTTYGMPVVHHGGDLIGHHSDMMWLPGHDVGAVVLTSGDPGWTLRGLFRRKLLEVLFDGEPEADAAMASSAASFFEQLVAERKLLTVPADREAAAALAPAYSNDALGGIAVRRDGEATVFDFGEWRSEVATRANPDGTLSFVTTAPGLTGIELVAGRSPAGRRTLTTRDAQHEYVFEERPGRER